MLKRIAIAVAAGIVLFLLFRYCQFRKDDEVATIEYNSNLIQQQILNVGKLVVTEGHFAEVLTYKDQDKYFGGVLSFEKKVLIIVNAEVTVAYDLHQMQYDIDEKNKTITLKSIPKEEIKISPEIRFYDVNQSKFNAFTGDDYNKINQSVRANLAKKLEKSSLKSNAKNRLVSELSKMLILTNSLGWTLRYDGKVIDSETALSEKIKG